MTKIEAAENWDRFGQWVASQRQAANLTQDQLAERIGLDKQQIYRIEKGGSTKRATVVKIAEALNADTEYAISLAFGVTGKKSAMETEDKQGQAIRAAELIKDFLTLTPAQQARAIAVIKILVSDRPELLQIMQAPIEIIEAGDLTASDAKETDTGDTPPKT